MMGGQTEQTFPGGQHLTTHKVEKENTAVNRTFIISKSSSTPTKVTHMFCLPQNTAFSMETSLRKLSQNQFSPVLAVQPLHKLSGMFTEPQEAASQYAVLSFHPLTGRELFP
jgi:hypothetical protein